jgi:hypothetical protein
VAPDVAEVDVASEIRMTDEFEVVEQSGFPGLPSLLRCLDRRIEPRVGVARTHRRVGGSRGCHERGCEHPSQDREEPHGSPPFG